MHHSQGPQEHPSEVRKHRRFDLQFPVLLSFPAGGEPRELEGVSENVSLGGVLVRAGDEIAVRTKVVLKMEVVSPRSRRSLRLAGEGEVVRVEAVEGGAAFVIAVKCDRLAEMEGYIRELD